MRELRNYVPFYIIYSTIPDNGRSDSMGCADKILDGIRKKKLSKSHPHDKGPLNTHQTNPEPAVVVGLELEFVLHSAGLSHRHNALRWHNVKEQKRNSQQ